MKIPLHIGNWGSLRTRLSIGMLVLGLVTLWTTALTLSHLLRQDMEASISAQQFSTVSLLASEIDRSLRERIAVVESIASRLAEKGLLAPDDVQAYLDQREIPSSTFNRGILVVDTAGIAIASTPEVFKRRGVDFSQYPGARDVLDNGKIHVTEPIFSQFSEQPVFAIAVPIRSSEGNTIGAVIGVTNLGNSNFLDEIGSAKYGNTGDFFITAPRNRTYVASSDKRRILKSGPPPGVNPVYDRYIDGYEGSGVALSSRGVVELSSSKRIPAAGWLMQSVLPAEEAFSPIRAMQRHLLLISVLLTVLACAASWWWLRRQLQPLSEASALLDQMREGRIPRQPLPVRKEDEIGQLATAFNALQEVIVAEEAKAAEHAANTRLRRIVSYVPGVVFQYRLHPDGHGDFPFTSDGITEMYGVTPEEMEEGSGSIRKMLHPQDQKRFFESLHESARTLAPWRTEYRIIHPDGRVKWLLAKAVPERSEGDIITWYGFIADITETKAMEAELRQALIAQKRQDEEIARYRDHLERLVDERTAALQAARAEAERLARIKSEFLANMSHEIRTPLNGVLGIAHLGLRSTRDDKAHQAFAKIIKSGTLLLGIINDILDYSRMEAGKLKIESTRVELSPLLAETLETMREPALAKGLVLELQPAPDLPAACLSDPLRLRQILLNLLANAVKFTESGKVVLSVETVDDELWLKVSDTGIGITESQIGVIFHSFEQGDNSITRKFGGTGLGLAITERIVNQMGGRITVASTPGEGSTFEVRLPYRAAGDIPEPAAKPTSEPPSMPAPPLSAPLPMPAGNRNRPLSGLNILIADDNEINQEIMQENLGEDGARVVVVGNGQQALDCVRNNPPGSFDLILMDIQMPVMDGHEATRKIHAIVPGLPIIGQTAHALPQDREACLAAGMVDHISKPIDPELLVELILKYTANRPVIH